MATHLTAELFLDTRATLAESPVWDAAAGRLLWVDIPAGLVHAHVPGGQPRTWPVGTDVGVVRPARDGGLVLGIRGGFARLDEDTGAVTLAAPVDGPPDLRFNDGEVSPDGRFFAGTMSDDQREGAGSLHRLDPDGTVTTVLPGVTVSNGLSWSPDGRTVHYADSPTRRVDAFDYDAGSGTLSGRRTVVTIEPDAGVPDGLCVDDDGGLWVAVNGSGAVRRYAPDGALDVVVELPVAQATSCCFGGPARDLLYISTAREHLDADALDAEPLAGGLFVARVGRTGPPAVPFAG